MNEAQEQLRQERMQNYAKKYGPYVIGIIVALIVVVSVKQGWKAYSEHQNRAQTQLLLSALDNPQSLQDLALNETTPQAVIAGLQAFGAMDDEAKKNQGLMLLETLSNDKNYPGLWSDYASLVYARAIQFYKEDVVADDILSILEPLANNEKSAFHAVALLESATVLVAHEKKYDEAQSFLDRIDDNALPSGLEQNHQNLQTYIRFVDRVQ